MSDLGPEFCDTTPIATIIPGAFGIPSPRPQGAEIPVEELNRRADRARILGVGSDGMSWKAGKDLLWIQRGRCMLRAGWFERG